MISRSDPIPSFASILGQTPAQSSRTVSTQRQRVLSPGEIANIPAGHTLQLDGVDWQLVTVTPAHATEPWATLTAAHAG